MPTTTTKKKRPAPSKPAATLRIQVDAELLDVINTAYHRFEGSITDLESAVGVLLVGGVVGYQAVRICHSYRYLTKLERILGVKFKEVLPERTDDSQCIRGVRIADRMQAAGSKFWQVVNSGQIKQADAVPFGGDLEIA